MLTILLTSYFSVFAAPSLAGIDFETPAKNNGINARILEGICRYESDNGRIRAHRNRNGSWDMGICQVNKRWSRYRPRIPADQTSVKEAAKAARYWFTQHKRFCVQRLKRTGKCGSFKYGKWRGVTNCKRPHYWWSHYNHGFRVLSNNYGRKVACFIQKGFKKCTRTEWRALKFSEPLF